MLARVAAASVAIVVCAWFVLGIRQAHNTTKVRNLVLNQGTFTAAQAAHEDSLLKAAKTLNPDLEVDVLRGQVAMFAGQLQRADQILESVVRREPDNIIGWIWLARSLGTGKGHYNVKLIKTAVANVARLDPLG